MYPRAGGGPPVNTNDCFLKGPTDWLRIGLFTSRFRSVRVCGGFFCPCGWVALGVGRSAVAVVSFALLVGARPVLVLVGPRGGGFVCLNVGWRLVSFFSIAFGVGPSRRVRWFRFSALLVV